MLGGATWRFGSAIVGSPITADFVSQASVCATAADLVGSVRGALPLVFWIGVAVGFLLGRSSIFGCRRNSAEGVHSAMELDRRGRGRPASIIGRQLDTKAEPSGAEWNPSPAFFFEYLEFVTWMTFDAMLRTAPEHSDALEEPEAEQSGRPTQAPAKKTPDQTEKPCHPKLLKSPGEVITLPPDVHVEEGMPDPSPDRRHAAWTTSDKHLGKITDLKAMLSFTISGIGLALYHGHAVIYSTQPPKDTSLDARVLGIRETNEAGLTAGDQSVVDHERCCRLLQLATVHDQLDITELACMELVSRKLQMCEHRHRERATGAIQGDELLEDAHLYLGVGETRVMAMAPPSLLSSVSEKLKTEAAILKEPRKMREERAEHQASASSKEGKGGQTAPHGSAHKQSPETTKLKAQLATPGMAGWKGDELGRPPGGK
ncbi:unnamed protein product [Prorocentrum cordatum]|uniref:Uncharacterized protein n=1 Tax=Prorocentrum cordatum TaxID=2364126 RepID=A0ABN9TJI4_9DINO|nr:unnamed protein product [Polarella glacialis]